MKSWFRNNDFWGKKYTFFFVKKTFFVFSKKHIFKIFFESAIVWHLPSKSINFYGFFIITFFLNFGELKIVTKMTLDMQNGISGVQFASTWGRRNRKKCVFSSKWAIIFQKMFPFRKCLVRTVSTSRAPNLQEPINRFMLCTQAGWTSTFRKCPRKCGRVPNCNYRSIRMLCTQAGWSSTFRKGPFQLRELRICKGINNCRSILMLCTQAGWS